jgi:serine/threonine protein kinase
MTTTTAHTGTERYLAPELVNGDDLEYPTPASDIYALGCLGLEVRFLHTYVGIKT